MDSMMEWTTSGTRAIPTGCIAISSYQPNRVPITTAVEEDSRIVVMADERSDQRRREGSSRASSCVLKALLMSKFLDWGTPTSQVVRPQEGTAHRWILALCEDGCVEAYGLASFSCKATT